MARRQITVMNMPLLVILIFICAGNSGQIEDKTLVPKVPQQFDFAQSCTGGPKNLGCV